jgi:hypothetical protein
MFALTLHPRFDIHVHNLDCGVATLIVYTYRLVVHSIRRLNMMDLCLFWLFV